MEEKEGEIPFKQTDDAKKLYSLFEKIFRSRVADNEHLIQPLFHYIVGTFINYYAQDVYLYRSTYHSAKLHTFIIQNSGTGKGESMDVSFRILQRIFHKRQTRDCKGKGYLDEPAIIELTSITDAGLLGSVNMNSKGVATVKHGSLAYCDSIFWNEGSVLLTKTKFTEDMMDIIQMACDGKAWVSRKLANGLINYRAKSSVLATSYWVDKFNEVLFYRGLFQRFFLSCKQLNVEQQTQLIKKINVLNQNSAPPWEIDALIDEMEVILNKMIPRLIGMNEQHLTRLRVSQKAQELTTKNVDILLDSVKQTFSDSKQSILLTFLSRFNVVLHPIACQYALLNNKKEIDDECIAYAFKACQWHIQSFTTLVDKIGKADESVEEKRIAIVLKAHRFLDPDNKGVPQEPLIEYLCSGNLKTWDKGIHTTRKFLHSLVVDHSPPILKIEVYPEKNNLHLFKRGNPRRDFSSFEDD